MLIAEPNYVKGEDVAVPGCVSAPLIPSHMASWTCSPFPNHFALEIPRTKAGIVLASGRLCSFSLVSWKARDFSQRRKPRFS